ncbi:serine peptidase [Trypanosoma rangeli]|uniref:Serine peptidase n=1 Tax=Trypanosoma rangeli TaxID=5698 RepID=A0A422NV23_TRYRA|nr:serine peptidase [Trypanosoma rangeli]RNF09299.1 serine peptidase [Trypanosoma rangeli]|eukprot:RNF09299.1 serine peptidase [Trypanosoma rangeli]
MASFFGSIVKSIILPKPIPSYDTSDHLGKLLHIPRVDWRTRKENGSFTYGLLLLDSTAKYIVIYAHTNAVDMAMMVGELSYFSKRASASVLLFEYTGYGISHGDTTETSMKEDMLSAYCYVARQLRVPPNRIVLMGRSIGTGPAAQLCAELQEESEVPALLVLQSPFTSLKECANEITRNVGSIVSFLGYDWFRTIDVIAQVRCPVIIQHGVLDDVVPFEHAERLKRAIEDAETPGLVELYMEKVCKHNDLPIASMARIVDRKLRGFGKERCLQIRCRAYLTVNPPIYEYLFCNNGKRIATLDALLQHWNETLAIGLFAYRREKLYILLVASVALFAMRCAQVWQCYTGNWKRQHSGEGGGDGSHCSKEDIINRYLGCCGSPLGVFLGVEGTPPLHKFFGVNVAAGATQGGDSNATAACMVYEDQTTYLSVAELEFTPGLMKSVVAAISTAPTLTDAAGSGTQVFLQQCVVTRIQTECERLVAFLDDGEWNNLLFLLLNFDATAATYLSSKALHFYNEFTSPVGGAGKPHENKESISDVKEWLQPWIATPNAQTCLGGEVPWDYYLFKARVCVQEDYQLRPYMCWAEAKRVMDAWLVVAEIYRLFTTHSRRCLRPAFTYT